MTFSNQETTNFVMPTQLENSSLCSKDYKDEKNIKCDNAYDYFNKILGSPQLIIGPMVDQSEQAFRILCRKYGAQLGFTPMLNAAQFVRDARYRKKNLYDCCNDRPLIVQFCCNDPDIFLNAAKLCVGFVDGIDLNLGCPQGIARKGHYGAFLQDEWDLIQRMLRNVHEQVPELPISCKVRIFSDVSRTLEYAQMLVESGCQMLTVHGRTREMKGQNTGIANWEQIRAVKQAVKIPVIANGNIQCWQDVQDCLTITGVDGVMSAEGLLHNPALFSRLHPPIWQIASEYIELVREHPCPDSFVRGHLFKICIHTLSLQPNHDLREKLSRINELKNFQDFVEELRMRYENNTYGSQTVPMSTLPVPVYVAQPFFRPPVAECNIPKKIRKELSESSEVCEELKQKGRKRPIKDIEKEQNFKAKKNSLYQLELCSNNCKNPQANECENFMCRSCCKVECTKKVLDCVKHRFCFKTKFVPKFVIE